MTLASRLHGFLDRRFIQRRDPDVIIGGKANPYLLRWFVIPRNPLFNIYLHEFRRSDDDRALHDHPWLNASFLLQGEYTEHTIEAGGVNVRRVRKAGSLTLRRSVAAHRIELHAGICRSLFVTGPRLRVWGFRCPAGWRDWRAFTSPADKGEIGRGCE